MTAMTAIARRGRAASIPAFGLSLSLALLVVASAAPRRAAATEAAAGHYISGALTGPGAGVVPPESGLYWSAQALTYQAKLTSSVQVPIGGRLENGLKAAFYSTAFTAIYVPPLDMGNLTYAAGVTIPIWSLTGRVFSNARERSETNTSLGDIVLSPVMLGWRPGGGNFVQMRLDVFAPTGEYELGSIANPGMNYWTVTPSIGYSHIGARHDLSIVAGLDINAKNSKTDYTSGGMFHVDASAIYDVVPEAGIGVMGSYMQQISDDHGGVAERLDGFRGRAWSAGPVARANFQLGSAHFNAALVWASEFGVSKRPEGNTVQLRISGRF